jgi:hypothetical protein
MNNIRKLKSQIYSHRSYRILTKTAKSKVFLELVIAMILFDIVILLLYPDITLLMNKFAKIILSPFYQNMKIISEPFILNDVYLLDITGKYPSFNFSVITAVVSSVVILIVAVQKFIIRSVSIWLIFISVITLISALYFVFFAKYFPYSMRVFLDLYVKTIVCIWLTIPVIMIFALAPFPMNLFKKLLSILFVLLWSMLFGILRYVVFIFILRKLSYIFMADLYFVLGPFLDFIYIVGIFSFIISKLADKLHGNEEKWHWLF